MAGLQRPKTNEPKKPPSLGEDSTTVAQEVFDAGQIGISDLELSFTFQSPVPPSFVNLERLSMAQRICKILKEPERLMRGLQRESIMQRLRKPISFVAAATGFPLIIAFADSAPFLAPSLGICIGLLFSKAFLPPRPSEQLEQNMRIQAFGTLHEISSEMNAQILSPEVTKRAQDLWSDRVHAIEQDLEDSKKIDKMIEARLFFNKDPSLEALQLEAIAENKEAMTPLHLLSPEKADRIRNILQNMQEALVVHETMGYLAEDDPDRHEVRLFSNYVISSNNVDSRETSFFKVIKGLSAIAGCDIAPVTGVPSKNS